ncbi:MAG: hypothetical protein J1G06_05000 [Oscillospiraceae bacterium]|nr:hypothetical protein [Oscillospiraceae bacterium]
MVQTQQLRTLNFGSVQVIGLLGSGGQGKVYKVNYNGQEKAMKWFHDSYLKNMDKDGGNKNKKAFFNNLKNNSEKNPPTGSFLWPQDIVINAGDNTENLKGSFGYIMDIRPQEYEELTKFLLLKARFATNEALINAAINTISGFSALHNDGYSYQDINNGGFFINPKNGDVLICDNDNIAGQNQNFGISGKQRYMAPEVVLGGTPDKYSDRFSLAVVLFRMIFMEHPLEGRYSTPPCMTPEFEKRYYGSDPVFIFDPNDKRNEASVNMQTNAYNLWPMFPDYIKQLFIDTFSSEAVKNPIKRPIEKKWIDAFVRLRGENVRCIKCGEENFVTSGKKIKCMKCGAEIEPSMTLKFKKFSIPVYPGVRISKWQVSDGYMDPIGIMGAVIANPNNPEMLGILNMYDKPWTVIAPSGNTKQVMPKEMLPARPGFKIVIDDNEGTIQ